MKQHFTELSLLKSLKLYRIVQEINGSSPALAKKYLPIFRNHLSPSEELINAGAAIDVFVSEYFGRGAGDGTLGITNQKLIHCTTSGQTRTILWKNIVSISKNWIIIPGSSRLNVQHNTELGNSNTNFYCGNRFCREIIELSKVFSRKIK